MAMIRCYVRQGDSPSEEGSTVHISQLSRVTRICALIKIVGHDLITLDYIRDINYDLYEAIK